MLINKIRIIICSDAKNEADDQYALVHAMLTNKFIIKGLVAGEFFDIFVIIGRIIYHMLKWLN